MSRFSRVWPRIRQIWISLGLGLTVIFVVWSLLAYRSSGAAKEALRSDEVVYVAESDDMLSFLPAAGAQARSVGLLFFPGALVDPVAYAPLTRAVADAGFSAYIVKLPRRGAFGGADQPRLYALIDSILASNGPVLEWAVGGHSRGGVVASNLAARKPLAIAGLILIGTSHPRDVDLSGLTVPVSKIVGTRDGLASPGEVEANEALLPNSTRWTWIEGGNHSQFGWYGFQPLDRRARISRQDQQTQMIRAVVATLHEVEGRGP
jgi:pimeloyl-ACP methyl ester carboxylesterase